MPGAKTSGQRNKALTRHTLLQEMHRRADLVQMVLSYLSATPTATTRTPPHTLSFVTNTLSTFLLESRAEDKKQTVRSIVGTCLSILAETQFPSIEQRNEAQRVALLLLGVISVKPFIFEPEPALAILQHLLLPIEDGRDPDTKAFAGVVLLSFLQTQRLDEPSTWANALVDHFATALAAPDDFLRSVGARCDVTSCLLLLMHASTPQLARLNGAIIGIVKQLGVDSMHVPWYLDVCYTIAQLKDATAHQRSIMHTVWCYLEASHPVLTMQVIQKEKYNVAQVMPSGSMDGTVAEESVLLQHGQMDDTEPWTMAQRLGIYSPHATVRAKAVEALLASTADEEELESVFALLQTDRSPELIGTILNMDAERYWRIFKDVGLSILRAWARHDGKILCLWTLKKEDSSSNHLDGTNRSCRHLSALDQPCHVATLRGASYRRAIAGAVCCHCDRR